MEPYFRLSHRRHWKATTVLVLFNRWKHSTLLCWRCWSWSSSCGRQSVDQFVWVSGLVLGALTRFYLTLIFSSGNYFILLLTVVCIYACKWWQRFFRPLYCYKQEIYIYIYICVCTCSKMLRILTVVYNIHNYWVAGPLSIARNSKY
jgi:hypothetical protein